MFLLPRNLRIQLSGKFIEKFNKFLLIFLLYFYQIPYRKLSYFLKVIEVNFSFEFSTGACMRICRKWVSLPFWWFATIAICNIYIRTGRDLPFSTWIAVHPEINLYVYVCISPKLLNIKTHLLARKALDFATLVSHWNWNQFSAKYAMACNFHLICSRHINKQQWYEFFYETEHWQDVVIDHLTANKCLLYYRADVQRQILQIIPLSACL